MSKFNPRKKFTNFLYWKNFFFIMRLSNNFIYAFTSEYYQPAKPVKCKSKAKQHTGTFLIKK